MTARAWNLSVLGFVLGSIGAIFAGAYITLGLGPSLIISGACLLGSTLLAAVTSIRG